MFERREKVYMKIMEKYRKEKEIILESGLEIVREYSLVNNYGYIIKLNNQEYDLRHWLNVYGASVNYWDVSSKSRASEEDRIILEQLEKKMNEEL